MYLIIYDDLTQHARAYRELSLLLRRPPGREAFPGDIFYIHSRLLERATRLRAELGGGSLTALPIVETEAENIADYIPTNLISITDGQIYLSPGLFELGVLPAIDVGKSVSRVGGKAQLPVFHSLAGSLKLAYSQFEEMEIFARFGTRLDENARKIIEHGRRIRACLKQSQFAPVPVSEQIVVLLALTAGLFDEVPLDQMPEAEHAVRQTARAASGNGPAKPFQPEAAQCRGTRSRSPSREQGAGLFPSSAMSETVFSLRRKIKGVHELKSVVRTMKAMAAASLGQYEQAAQALELYAGTVERGLVVCLRHLRFVEPGHPEDKKRTLALGVLVFGSDQGMVGQFNEHLAEFVTRRLSAQPGRPIWGLSASASRRVLRTPASLSNSFIPRRAPWLAPRRWWGRSRWISIGAARLARLTNFSFSTTGPN